MSEGSVTLWIDQLKAGNTKAAADLWNRYYARLVVLARDKLAGAVRRAVDEEDVALNAFASFCRGVEEARFPRLTGRDDLWQLLVMLTARKAINQRKHLRSLKRGGGKARGESAIEPADGEIQRGLEQVIGIEPTPQFAAEVAEEFRNLLGRLEDDVLRLIAFFKFEGRTNPEIAASLDCSLTSVERKLRLIRRHLAEDQPAMEGN